MGGPSWSANHHSQGRGQEEEEGRRRQDCLLRLPRLSERPNDHPAQLRAALCALPGPEHAQEAGRRGAAADYAPADL